ncbi:hypothetical protein OUZ56_029001 [Daphnia magna]|uniref:Uncharacterized protein n=1 Tax=Daphnia magna TaxID=35525 RepID=A0ABR0B5I0_9CRUS|nr:hypothetical protein OUZ56_029001 [Daphnia magna]
MQRHSKNNKKTIRIDYKPRQRICLFLCETKQMTEHQDERSVLMLRLILNNHVNKSILFRQWPTKTWRNELRSRRARTIVGVLRSIFKGRNRLLRLTSLFDDGRSVDDVDGQQSEGGRDGEAQRTGHDVASFIHGGGGADADEVRKTYRKRAQCGRGKCGRLGQCQIRTDQSSRRIILTAAPID